jgi:4'-phosphopantetheinyl transferase
MRFPDLDTDVLFRAAGTCRVWWASPSWGTELGDLLQPVERVRASRLRRPEDRDRFVTGCVLLRLLLGNVLATDPAGVPIVRYCLACGRPHGKPRLAGRGWEFSVSHSGDRVGVALARQMPVGLDVEHVSPAAAGDLVDHLLTAQEARHLAGVPTGPREAAILRVWVRKEAVVKAIGTGLGTDLTSFGLGSPLRPPRATGLVAGIPASEISVVDLSPGGPHVGSLAAIGRLDFVDEVGLDEAVAPAGRPGR